MVFCLSSSAFLANIMTESHVNNLYRQTLPFVFADVLHERRLLPPPASLPEARPGDREQPAHERAAGRLDLYDGVRLAGPPG